MALGNVCMTKQRKEMGVQILQYVFFLEKQNKTETGTKLKRKPKIIKLNLEWRTIMGK